MTSRTGLIGPQELTFPHRLNFEFPCPTPLTSSALLTLPQLQACPGLDRGGGVPFASALPAFLPPSRPAAGTGQGCLWAPTRLLHLLPLREALLATPWTWTPDETLGQSSLLL